MSRCYGGQSRKYLVNISDDYRACSFMCACVYFTKCLQCIHTKI